jgi:hypothetical protein
VRYIADLEYVVARDGQLGPSGLNDRTHAGRAYRFHDHRAELVRMMSVPRSAAWTMSSLIADTKSMVARRLPASDPGCIRARISDRESPDSLRHSNPTSRTMPANVS